jgi:hypothetical protein
MIRIVATTQALDATQWQTGARVFRIAKDEVMVLPPTTEPYMAEIADPHAIIMPEHGFVGVWMPRHHADVIFVRHCEWEPPHERPAFAQGAIAGIAVKVYFEHDRALFIVPQAFAHDFSSRCFG